MSAERDNPQINYSLVSDEVFYGLGEGQEPLQSGEFEIVRPGQTVVLKHQSAPPIDRTRTSIRLPITED